MALTWSIRDIADFKEQCYHVVEETVPMMDLRAGEYMLNPITENLIWATIPIGMPELTADNAAEFYARLSFWEKLYGCFLREKDEHGTYRERPFTPADVHAHIGLKTNATRYTKAQFLKNCADRLRTFSALYDNILASEQYEKGR